MQPQRGPAIMGSHRGRSTRECAGCPYWAETAIVTAGLFTPPICTTTGTELVAAKPDGILTLICIAPATRVGAPPAYGISSAFRPPMVTVTGCKGVVRFVR